MEDSRLSYDDVDETSESLLEKFTYDKPKRSSRALFYSLNRGSWGTSSSIDKTVYSPAQEAVNFERVRFNATLVIESPYNGEPGPEVDAAWHELLSYMNIAVSGSDLDRIGASSIPIPDQEGQYVAGLNVFHELHCLKRIRQYTWADYYHPNATEEDSRLNRLHADHCIDVLRQAILCHSDISLFTLEWSQAQSKPRANFSHEHTCVNWGAILAWARERSVPESTMKNLKHPILDCTSKIDQYGEKGVKKDLDDRCESISKTLPGAASYELTSKLDLWSLFQSQNVPRCVVLPTNAEEVAVILGAARTHECQFAVLAGGTSPNKHASNIEGGITISMHRMKNVEVVDSEMLHVQAGAGSLWADVYRELDMRNMSATGTRNGLTGVTGSILGGGISFFSQQNGWACDTVVRFEVVLANSSIAQISHLSHPELFFALRGGGNNFGIVTRVTFEAFRNPPSWYTFQLWEMSVRGTVFQRLHNHTLRMPKGVCQIAVTLGWHTPTKKFVISERMVSSERPYLPDSLPFPGSHEGNHSSPAVATTVYNQPVLKMSQKMDFLNPPGYYNYFGTHTVKSDDKAHMLIAKIFLEEAEAVVDVNDLKLYIVYNPLTIETIQKMGLRGGNCLGINEHDGPLTIVNINMHWRNPSDTPRMRSLMKNLLRRFQVTTKEMEMFHPYIFQNHAFEEQDVFSGYGKDNLLKLRKVRKQVDPNGVFQKLQPGYFKIGEVKEDNENYKSEL
ncbi:hypothetical protein G7Y89_g9408 [Cudoniella acicularis]|uniref:FAD-binding PCMH-type domain-containing protein n=1 Tax=Cudoniella acicularis TaxID=354080 RepID=A0A8H4RHI4_9HELO|nr:hypothetical protein G7Y89_g9408 [Cudoniella acicularis]